MPLADLIDQIYEAALVPDLWPDVLTQIASASAAHSGAMLIVDRSLPPLFKATDNIADVLSDFAASANWHDNILLHRLQARKYAGFLEVSEFLDDVERHEGEFHSDNMREIGAAWQVGSVVDMPEGGMVAFTFERDLGMSDFSPSELGFLDRLRPHLARASLMSMRIALERSRANVAMLGTLGVPAAILKADGVVLTSNTLFESLHEVLWPGAFGRLRLPSRGADQLLMKALAERGAASHSIPLSLPDQRYLVLHVLPLEGGAVETFGHGVALVSVTGYRAADNIPSDALLRGLFDLSPSEVDVAAGLAAGLVIKDIAARRGISIATVRTHLAQIFRKTGTGQQSELVALLKGSYPLGPVDLG